MQLAPTGQPVRSKILALICTEKRDFERLLVIERHGEKERGGGGNGNESSGG
jgi:hypothetical protein